MDEGYYNFIAQIKKRTGVDLTLYKETQMKRRLTSLRNKQGYTHFEPYSQALNSNNQLLHEVMDRTTINVSEFYRNSKRWNVLKNDILPTLIKEKKRIFVWSAACSTGEEPYSMALMGAEHFPDIAFDILATDIDDTALEKAKVGVYKEKALKELPEYMKKKYFTETGGLFQLNPQLKQQVTFQKHNLLRDSYPGDIDLIICRNVLIYFTDEAKSIIYQRFRDTLTAYGVLFVGSTEQIFNPRQYGLELEDTFFYRRN